jgi:hypothetical protein
VVDDANFATEYEEICANVKSEPHRQTVQPVRQHFHNKKPKGSSSPHALGMGIDKSILFVDAKIAVQAWRPVGGAS